MGLVGIQVRKDTQIGFLQTVLAEKKKTVIASQILIEFSRINVKQKNK